MAYSVKANENRGLNFIFIFRKEPVVTDESALRFVIYASTEFEIF